MLREARRQDIVRQDVEHWIADRYDVDSASGGEGARFEAFDHARFQCQLVQINLKKRSVIFLFVCERMQKKKKTKK